MAAVAVVSLGAGLGLSRLIVSPAEAAAEAAAPEARAITVPVEQRVLANDVVMRGDVVYEDPVDVTLETGDLGGPAVVTGGVPEPGSTVDAGTVLLEVTGRPVLALPGALPVYRTLRAGVSGPDVLQLKQALVSLGIDAGDPTDPVYDTTTSAAVEALYARSGYPAPALDEEVSAQVEAAVDAVDAAEEGVRLARADLDSASRGEVSRPQQVALQAAVDTAEAVLKETRDRCAAEPDTCVASEVTAAEGAVATAVAERDAAAAPPDTSAQRAALTAAQKVQERARDDLAEARAAAVTHLPASEVVYLASLPRRVDSVAVDRGTTVSGSAVMSVSGATLQVTGTIPDSDAALVEVGAEATIALPDDGEVTGTVASLGDPEPASGDAQATAGRTQVVITPGEVTEKQRTALQGANVRVTIPVSSTSGEVLAVPLAALTAGPGGEARVEVLDGDVSTLVEVTTGLAADGFVEVTAVDGELSTADRVVVGEAGQVPAADDPADEDDSPSDDDEETGGSDA